ncbi:carboxylesterase/lipase family protein [Butyrivibrio sp. MC2013]|uniref:carboxylesterase/lipase family protein n=1 Tax=Butyrivibrio sp. MC2013 TaxID=1280686 RepID=UPI0003F59D00|nr:carboxylesterase family protein [Butyrivibrio sp. MC2013]
MKRTFEYDNKANLVSCKAGKIRGYREAGSLVFKGITYARAQRFHRPQPYVYEEEFDASNYGYVAPLLTNDRPGGEVLVPHRYWPQDEDCLNLNIWTPDADDKKRPVMVWLHGGGFFAGSSIEQLAYEGGNMSQRGDVVVVSLNHRLNILGFFDLSDFGPEYENSGNAGMDDIICALKWIRDNIGYFGGDPDNVTLFGQSGGGAKITCLLQMHEADGLFSRGINMSGVITGTLCDCTDTEKGLAEAIMKDLGLSDIKELETVELHALISSYNKLSGAFMKAGKSIGQNPHVNSFYRGDPVIYGFRSESASVPLMVGSVFGEFYSFAHMPYDKRNMSAEEGRAFLREIFRRKKEPMEILEKLLEEFEKAYPERNPVDLYTLDTIFRKGEQKYILDRAAICPGGTYSYMFNVDMPVDGGRTPWHCADIPYVFANTCLCPYTWDEDVRQELEDSIFGAVMAFARTGSPETNKTGNWPACTMDTDNIMVINADGWQLRPDFDKELIPMASEHDLHMEIGEIQH